MRSRAEREADLVQAVKRFHRGAFGRDPVAARAFLFDGVAVVALRGVLTAPEARLAGSGDPVDAALVREVRGRLVRRSEAELVAAAEAALGVRVRAVLADADPAADEAEPLMAAEGLLASRTAPTAALAKADLQPLLAEALRRWGAGADTSALANLDIRIADLGGTTLALASGNTIWLDDDAAGWGWFIDATPSDDSEFYLPDDQGEQNRMDLLGALMHEIGHVLGHDHEDDGVMGEALAAGERSGLSGVYVDDPVAFFAPPGAGEHDLDLFAGRRKR